MNTKLVYGITLTVGLFIAALFVFNLISLFSVYRPNPYFNPNQVRGMAVYHNNIPYTLNFAQQNSVINYLNEAIEINMPSESKQAPFEKIVIYRFDEPELTLAPIGTIQDNNLVFPATAWKRSGYRATPRELMELINLTFDK